MENNNKVITFGVFDWLILVFAILGLLGSILVVRSDLIPILFGDLPNNFIQLFVDIIGIIFFGWLLKTKVVKFKKTKLNKSGI